MLRRMEISCVNKTAGEGPYECVKSVGGYSPDGTRWKFSQAAAIRAVEQGTHQFYVTCGEAVAVTVAEHHGRKYLRTDPDKTLENRLLELDACPDDSFSARL